MNAYAGELSKILDILKANPRGMSVSDIAGEVGVNRNTVSRYLDMLLISGQVDLKTYGKAKVYFISQRIPISAMFDFSSDLMFVIDHEMYIIQVNDALCRFIMAKREDLISKKIRDSRLTAFDHPLIMAKIKEAFSGTETSDELRFVRVDEVMYYRVRIIPAVFNDGSPAVTVMLEDITEHKKAEEALRESENTYRSLVEEINDAIWILNDEMIFTYVSPRTTDILGYTPDEMTGNSIFDYMEQKTAGKVKEAFFSGKEHSSADCLVEIAMRHTDGSSVILESSGCPQFDELNDLIGYRLVCRDISDRRKAIRRVSQWKSFLHSIVRNIPAMVLVKELETNTFIFFNRQAEEVLGGGQELPVGKHSGELFPEPLSDLLIAGDDEVVQTDLPVELPEQAVSIPGGGRRVLRARKVPIYNSKSSPKYILTIVEDITKRKEAEDLLKRQRDQAQSYLDLAGVMIAVVDRNGEITSINRKGCQILGYEEEADLVGQDWFSTVVPLRMREIIRQNFSCISSGEFSPPDSERGNLLKKNGEERAVVWHNTLIRDSDGTISAMVCSAEEVSEKDCEEV